VLLQARGLTYNFYKWRSDPFYDVLATDASLELHFPVPWAENSETSFLFTQDETSSVLVTAALHDHRIGRCDHRSAQMDRSTKAAYSRIQSRDRYGPAVR
jgi:hypothetical protein